MLTRRSTRRRSHAQSPWGLRALGLAVLASLALLVYLGWQRPHLIGDDGKTTVRALFDSAHGVSEVGNDVRIAGAPVGRIDKLERRGDDALITMLVEDASAERLRRDASAELRPRFAFEGTAFIELRPGSPSAPALDGRTIPRARTQVYVPLDQALKFARRDTRGHARATVRDAAAALDAGGADALGGVLRKAPRLGNRLAKGMRAAAGAQRRELAGTVAGAARTLAALAREERSLPGFMRGSEQTMAALHADGGAAIDATLRSAPPTLRELGRGSDALVRVLDQLDPLVADIRPGMRALDPALREAAPLLAAAPAALRSTGTVVRRLRAAVATGGRIAPSARRLLSDLRPPVRKLERSLLPALHADTPDLEIPAYVAVLNVLGGGAGAFAPYQEAQRNPTPPQTGVGHFVRFDGHFYTGLGIPVPPCTLLERANPKLADQLANVGLCSR